ncbi:hypothetical protein [Henriciella sp.]|uniref:hypothetical protein n=1 Tax=Henriciella sp. TaxID=1968823 RepID=UPI00262F7E2F|nr:hypothetical protein [Henriciella sp.]
MTDSIKIDPEFKSYIPPLTDEEFAQLEANIVEEGCRDPLVVWGNTLIDGHNRYDICKRNGLDFATVQKEFADREAALDWMDAHQLGRRNLTPDQRRLLLGRRYNRVKRSKEQNLVQNSPNPQSEVSGGNTAERLAKEHGVSRATVERAAKFADEVDQNPEYKAAVETGKSVASVKREQEPAGSYAPQSKPEPEPEDPAEAKLRKQYRALTDAAREDAYVGLSLDLQDARAKHKEQAAEIKALKDQVKGFDGDQAETIRRQAQTIRHKESEMFRANEKADKALARARHLERELADIKRVGIAV